ncbi:hypothetical protein FB567DRAFT_550321 [Paraphoma chrysanthemicola]|uniref:Uncharacterized protein n=1 Tax=Paraphoma chrysanthemicola TaxID=798071 RepID=A0A8K0R3F5_9PLEO|nr:hypothetical protein FB567DRAFT_550321 [Paraphoma chrysanthemicola]
MAKNSQPQTTPFTDQSPNSKRQRVETDLPARGHGKKRASAAAYDFDMEANLGGGDDNTRPNRDTDSDDEYDEKGKAAISKEVAKVKKNAKRPSPIFGTTAIAKNLRIPDDGEFTAVEILVFLPNWVRRFEVLFRLVENGWDRQPMIKVFLMHRDSSGDKHHPRFDSALHHAFKKVFEDQGYNGWNITRHQDGEFCLSLDELDATNLYWDDEDLTFAGGIAMFNYVVEKENGTLINNVAFKSLANGVVKFPNASNGDALHLTPCVEYAVQNPDEDLLFPRDYGMLRTRLGLGAARREHQDRESLDRWKKFPMPKAVEETADDDTNSAPATNPAAREPGQQSTSRAPPSSGLQDNANFTLPSTPQQDLDTAMEGVENEMHDGTSPGSEHSATPHYDQDQMMEQSSEHSAQHDMSQSPTQYDYAGAQHGQQQDGVDAFFTAQHSQLDSGIPQWLASYPPSTPPPYQAQQLRDGQQARRGQRSGPYPGSPLASLPCSQPQVGSPRLGYEAPQPFMAPNSGTHPFGAMDSFPMPTSGPHVLSQPLGHTSMIDRKYDFARPGDFYQFYSPPAHPFGNPSSPERTTGSLPADSPDSPPAPTNTQAEHTTGLWTVPGQDGSKAAPTPADAYDEFTDKFLDHDWVPSTFTPSQLEALAVAEAFQQRFIPQRKWEEEHAEDLKNHVYH